MMINVIVVVTSLALGATHAQFAPSCSFNDGQCMYNIQLGHHGSCDKRAVTSGSEGCCDALQGQVTGLTGDVNTLKSQVSTLMAELMASKTNATATQDNLSQSQREVQRLLETLAQRETELNSTQAQLSKVLGQAGDEIRTLRGEVGRLTSELNTCKGTLGLATNTSSFPLDSILPSDVSLSFCDFEGSSANSSDVLCGFRNTTGHFYRGAGQVSTNTGPREDHSLGSPHGHYMYLDATKTGSSSSSSIKTVTMTSAEYPPGPGYCIRFWYNMYGTDIKDLKVYAKVGTGAGYPIFSHSKFLHSDNTWHLAEADLDSEYTSHPFALLISATTGAYTSSYYGPQHNEGDIAVDDLYVYNTSCKNVPLCPSGAVTRDSAGTTYCYTFHVAPLTWYRAASACRREGATSSLVTVNSKEEQAFLVQAIRNDTALMAAGQYGFYTAGNDERAEQTFDWTDTGTPYHGTYTNWKAGQPNDVGSDQDCMMLQYPDLDFAWGDVDCDERHPYICKTEHPTPRTSGSASNPMVG